MTEQRMTKRQALDVIQSGRVILAYPRNGIVRIDGFKTRRATDAAIKAVTAHNKH